MITAILNCYKRPEYLVEQINALKNQSIPPSEIMIWYNNPEDQDQLDLSELGVKVVYSSHNFKFHGRFAFGLLAKTKYVAFFDDDTIPGVDWFKNCLQHIDSNSILGSAGVIINADTYNPHTKIGWNGRRFDYKQEVDLVGHAWFLEKNILNYLWRQEPVSWDNGEDIQLSFFSYMHGGIKTFVPPHPENTKEVWGSIKGMEYGNDTNASWKIKNHSPLRDEIVTSLIEQGYIPFNRR